MLLPLLIGFTLLGGQNAPSTPYAMSGKLAIRSATLSRKQVPRYEKLEIKLDLSATYKNPFDREEVWVQALFTAPGGDTLQVPAFLDQPFTRKLENGEERLTAAGPPVWKVRFTPTIVGKWAYKIFLRDSTGDISTATALFEVIPSSHPGFLRRSRNAPTMFAFNNEKPFFPIGENMGWAGKRGTYDYDDWLTALGKAGGNWARFWMNSWNVGIEWSKGTKEGDREGYYGVGVYNLANAWKLDTILDTAERSGIYPMVCFGTYGEFTTGGFFNEGQWKDNPYNKANGGPCDKPEDFWKNDEAKRLYKNRLRYLMARYGWRTSIHAWEFWNEANAPVSWVGEMARYLKGTDEAEATPGDPHGHLLTTTYGNVAVWELSEIDFTQSHHYGTGEIPDHAPVIYRDAQQHLTFQKPHLMGEFGIDWRKSDAEYDPDGKAINLHNGLWASVCGGGSGSAMIWWWDNYIHPKNLYGQFTPLRRFVDTIPWTEEGKSSPVKEAKKPADADDAEQPTRRRDTWRTLVMDAPQAAPATETFTDMTLPASSGWGKSAETVFRLTPFGVAENKVLPQFLYSPAKADLRTTPTFQVKFDQPGRFVLRVQNVSDRVTLRLLLDGQPAQELKLSASPPKEAGAKPEYESTEFKKEYNVYQARFNKEYGIDVPAGEHTLQLECTEGDWVSLESLTLTNYRSSRYPPLNLYGMQNGKRAILWAHNALRNWKNVLEQKPVPVIMGATTTVRGLPDGRYVVEWWDTEKGVVIDRAQGTCKGNALALKFPHIASDVAAHIIPTSSK